MVTKINAIQVKHESGNVKDVLDTVKPITNYANLRTYTGSATQVHITDPGIAGFFYYDTNDTTSVDNGGTIIVNGSKRWKRLDTECISVSHFGAEFDGSDESNAARAMLAAHNFLYIPKNKTLVCKNIELQSLATVQCAGTLNSG